MSRVYFLILVSVLVYACQPSLDPQQYLAWSQANQKNGVSISSTDQYRVELKYQPKELVFLQRGGASLSPSQQQVLWNEIDLMEFFTLELAPLGQMEASLEDNYYFSYRFSEDIELMEDGKGKNPALFHFERSNDLKSNKTFVMGFERNSETSGQIKKVRIANQRISDDPILLEINTKKFPKLKL